MGNIMTQDAILLLQNRLAKVSNELFIAILGGCFLAVISQVALPLPFTPIPMTLQTLGLFLLAGSLGSRRAVSCVVAYLAQGAIGFPVFAGGVANPFWFVDIKAGFLVSFLAAAVIVGRLLEKRANPHFVYVLSVLGLGQLAIFAIGAAWLSFFVGVNKAILFGVLPFLSGALLKIVVASLLLKARALFNQ